MKISIYDLLKLDNRNYNTEIHPDSDIAKQLLMMDKIDSDWYYSTDDGDVVEVKNFVHFNNDAWNTCAEKDPDFEYAYIDAEIYGFYLKGDTEPAVITYDITGVETKLFVLDESKYYKVRMYIAACLYGYYFDRKPIDEEFKADLNTVLDIHDKFDEVEFEIEDNHLLYRGFRPTLHPCNTIAIGDLIKLDYQSISYHFINNSLIEIINWLYGRVYPIDTDDGILQLNDGFLSNRKYIVKQYITPGTGSEIYRAEVDGAIYSIQDEDGTYICIITNDVDYTDDRLYVLDYDRFSSLWLEIAYTSGIFKLLPEDGVTKDLDNTFIEIPDDFVKLQDNKLIQMKYSEVQNNGQ